MKIVVEPQSRMSTNLIVTALVIYQMNSVGSLGTVVYLSYSIIKTVAAGVYSCLFKHRRGKGNYKKKEDEKTDTTVTVGRPSGGSKKPPGLQSVVNVANVTNVFYCEPPIYSIPGGYRVSCVQPKCAPKSQLPEDMSFVTNMSDDDNYTVYSIDDNASATSVVSWIEINEDELALGLEPEARVEHSI